MNATNSARTITSALLFAVVSFAVYAQESITMVSYGGAYAKAQQESYIAAFTKETGIEVKLEDYSGGLAQIRAQVDAGSVHWDVVDVEAAPLTTGCDEGLFEYVDELELPPAPDGTPAEEDFFEGQIGECGIGTLVYATVITYNSENIDGDPPTSVADFFDLEKFPGRRSMQRSPVANLEFALMGDGVPAEDVYDILSTDEGLQRAFDKLNAIKDQVVWWETGAQPPQLLADGEVVLSTAWNGRVFQAQNEEDQPLVIVWNGHVRDTGSLAVVAGAPNYENAMKFIAFATSAESMASIAEHISYAPLRHSALPMIGNHVVTDIDMQPHMPTHPDNSKNYLYLNVSWWSERLDELTERFNTWLSR